MPRRPYKKTVTKPDPLYNSYEVEKLVNYVMIDGKKSIAYDIVYGAFERLKKEKLNPSEVLNKVIENTAPTHEVKSKRVGGASYLVPSETRSQRKLYLSFSAIITAAKARPNKQYHTFEEKLFAELMDAYQKQGGAVEKKTQAEKLA
ncbi:MAG: 30S ribosomal protein S7, partial [Candidatus Roizmanbacteria bacterium]